MTSLFRYKEILRFSPTFFYKHTSSKPGVRYFLSSAFYCDDLWKKRLENPLLKNINMTEYFMEIDRKFNGKKKVSGIDVDLFALGVTDEEQLEELENVIRRFRQSKYTIETLDSTHHSVVRAFLKLKRFERLLVVLNDRIKCGIFPDHYTYAIILDTLLENKDYLNAAKAAVLLTLQEDCSNEVSRVLALYACHMYLKEPPTQPWHPPKEEVVEEEVDEEEEVYERIPFLRNEFFDDHFDLSDPKHLVGKALSFLTKNDNSALGLTYQLIGLGMYEKWDKAEALINQLLKNQNYEVLETGIENFKNSLNSIPEDQEKTKEKILLRFEPIHEKLIKHQKIKKGDLNELMNEKLKTISQYENGCIDLQTKLFETWEQKRKESFDQQIRDFINEDRRRTIEAKKLELADKEELLFFFENWNKHEMTLAEIEKLEEEKKAKIDIKALEDSYVPPDVRESLKLLKNAK